MSTVRATNFQHASASNPAIVLAADGTAAATVSGINGGPLAGFRNAIINGNFDIWQRGTSFTALEYGADRWVNARVGTTCTMSRLAFAAGDNPTGDNPRFACRMTVGSVAGSSNFAALNQRIEGVRTFAGQTITVSFWAKADAAKPVALDLVQDFGTGGSPSATVNGIGAQKFNLTTSWTRYTATINVPSIAGKTLGSDGNDYLTLAIWFDAGSDFNSRTDSLGQQSGTFDIAQVQIEAGPVATPFERRPIGMELALCQRYYEIGELSLFSGNVTSGGGYNSLVKFSVAKRAEPLITRANAANSNFPTTAVNVFPKTDSFREERQANGTGNGFFVSSWTASAEL